LREEGTMTWRLLPEGTFDGYTNMAIDEAIQERVADGADPVVRFYRWQPSTVSIGYFQRMREEVDVDTCEELGVDYLRRRTGGGAVYHDYEGELTYSIIAPEERFPSDVTESYREICGWLIDAFERLGIDATFAPINDVEVDGRKISGNAQTRRDGVLLQHGTVLYDLDPERMFSALQVDAEKISDKMIEGARDRVCTVRSASDATREDLRAALIESFVADRDYREDGYREDELDRAATLAEERYRSEEWTFKRARQAAD
jgi:lipoate-protein ligase A